VGVEGLELLCLAQLPDHLRCRLERVLPLGEHLDEAGPPLEELRELLDAQLPRYVVHE